MSVVQVSLGQVIEQLGQSFHSLDLRAAVTKSASGWQRVLTGIRISPRPVEAVKKHYAELEANFGERAIDVFRVLLQAVPFTELGAISDSLRQARITVEGEQIALSQSWSFDALQGRIERHHQLIPSSDGEAWPAFYWSGGDRSAVYHQQDVTTAIRGRLGLRSVEELIDAFLELKGSSSFALDSFVYVEMPAKIVSVKAVGQTVEVRLTAEKNLTGLHLFLSRRTPNAITLAQHQELELTPVGNGGLYSLFQARASLNSPGHDDFISCVLTQDGIPELDEETGRFRQFMPRAEKNPLLECLKQFLDVSRLYKQIERPYTTSVKSYQKGPQDAFQKSVARLLSLAGFQVIDLERQDKLRDSETKVERATVDILAYHEERKILVLGACTISPPKAEDFDKLLHVQAILARLFSQDSPLRLIPVLCSGQENSSPFKGDAASQGLRMLNAGELAILGKLIESGNEDRFYQFLESPTEAELTEKSV